MPFPPATPAITSIVTRSATEIDLTWSAAARFLLPGGRVEYRRRLDSRRQPGRNLLPGHQSRPQYPLLVPGSRCEPVWRIELVIVRTRNDLPGGTDGPRCGRTADRNRSVVERGGGGGLHGHGRQRWAQRRRRWPEQLLGHRPGLRHPLHIQGHCREFNGRHRIRPGERGHLRTRAERYRQDGFVVRNRPSVERCVGLSNLLHR